MIEKEINNILLGKLPLCAVVYHIGKSRQGHYVCTVNDGQSWYTCNYDRIDLTVKLRCNLSIKDDILIPSLLIYEEVIELEIPRHLEIPNVMHIGKSTLATFQDKYANNDENDYNKDVLHYEGKGHQIGQSRKC